MQAGAAFQAFFVWADDGGRQFVPFFPGIGGLGFFHAIKRFAEPAGEHAGHVLAPLGTLEVEDIGRFDPAGDTFNGEIADDFRRWGDFDDVTAELVDLGVSAGDFRPAMSHAHAVRLFFEVGVLAAGHLVQIDFRGAIRLAGVKRLVIRPDRRPIIGIPLQRERIQLGVTRRVLQRSHNRVQIRLAGAAAERGNGSIGDVHAGRGGLDDARCIQAAGVMGVEMDGQTDFFFECFHQFFRGEWATEAGHVFDAQHVGAHFFQLLGESHIISEIIFVALRIEDVAGVAERAFADGSGVFAHRFHGCGQVG